MLPKTPEALRAQARTLADAADAAARWFFRPEPACLTDARSARNRARAWRADAIVLMKKSRGHANKDLAEFSFSLREAVENSVEAVSDAAQWGVAADVELSSMCVRLRDGAKALTRAADAEGTQRLEGVIEAKRFAASVERACRELQTNAQESPFFIEYVKRSEIAARLSAAAEGLQQACDAWAGSLGE